MWCMVVDYRVYFLFCIFASVVDINLGLVISASFYAQTSVIQQLISLPALFQKAHCVVSERLSREKHQLPSPAIHGQCLGPTKQNERSNFSKLSSNC